MYKTPFAGASTLHGLAKSLGYMNKPDMAQVVTMGAERIASLEDALRDLLKETDNPRVLGMMTASGNMARVKARALLSQDSAQQSAQSDGMICTCKTDIGDGLMLLKPSCPVHDRQTAG